MSLRLVLHPSVHVITATFAVFSIWAAHQDATRLPPVDPDLAQAVLVFRNGLDVDTLELSGGTGQFVSALLSGQPVLEAAGVASSDDPEFDLSHALALMLRWQLVTHLTTEAQHEDNPDVHLLQRLS